MISAIVRFSLRFRGIVLALACLFAGYGLYQASQARYDVFPEFAPPQVVIQTEAPGLSPEQVEVLVTQPIESAVNGVAGIDTLRSSSIQGLSLVTVVFSAESDIYRDRQVVAERLAGLAGLLPEGVKAPGLTPLTTSTSVVLVVGLTAEKRSLMDVRTEAEWTVKPRLLAVPGVASVVIFGGEVRQLQIQVDPARLVRYDLSLDEVLTAARRATGLRGAGFIETENQRLTLRTEGASLRPEDIARTLIRQSRGVSVTLGDAADVVEAPEPATGAASVMGDPGVILNVSAQYGANTAEVTRAVEGALAGLRPTLRTAGIELHGDLFRPANFIATAARNIGTSLALGALLVVVILFLFLMNLRTAAISCAAIPLSLLGAVVALEHLGLSLNTMTLGGLAIAIGAVVDDAVIDVENILRRLRENRLLAPPRPNLQVVLDASLEVRGAIVYATFAIGLVFLPVLGLTGVAGRLFGPLAIAFILAILTSLGVALTVTPALCLVLLPRALSTEEPRFSAWLRQRYRQLLLHVEGHPRAVLAAVAIFTLAGLATLPFFGGGFLPELREGHFIIHLSTTPGTSLAESLRVGREVTNALLGTPYVRSVAQRVGRAEKADDVFGSHYSELEVELTPFANERGEEAQAALRRVLAGFPGTTSSLKTFLTERVEETVSGYTASVVVQVFGSDLDALDRLAGRTAAILGKVRGATEVQVQSPPGMPELAIRLRRPDLLRRGLAPLDVLEAVATAYQGAVVGQVYDGNRVFDVAVVLLPTQRNDLAAVGNLPLRNQDGVFVALRDVADIYPSSGRYGVLHQGVRRVQTVTCNVAGRDVGSFAAEAKQKLATLALPAGYYFELGGAAEAQARSRHDLAIHAAVAGAGVVLLLSFVFGSGRNLALLLANLPLALVGGVLAALASGGQLSLGSLVGFVTVFGITLRNSMMLVAHFEHLVREEGLPWGLETALCGASERLVPILMTALVTAFGLLPMALASGSPGREIEGPMAVVILGGLATSTCLNLLILPALALRFGRFEAAPEDR